MCSQLTPGATAAFQALQKLEPVGLTEMLLVPVYSWLPMLNDVGVTVYEQIIWPSMGVAKTKAAAKSLIALIIVEPRLGSAASRPCATALDRETTGSGR